MNRVLKWVVGIVAVGASGFVVGFLAHFMGISETWTAPLVLVVCWAVILQLKERGWW